MSPETAAAYASGGLSEVELEALEEHIDGCAPCRQLVSQVAQLAAVSGHSPASAPTLPRTPEGEVDLLSDGTVVSRYVIDGLLGAGGMGVVYAAHDPTLARRVALKALRQDLIASGHSAAELLRREAMAMARLAHPNVVGVHDLFEADGTIFVAMDFIEGTTLRQWLRREPRSQRDIVAAFVQAGRGLAAAHEEGIVHRDFKPDNVLCGRGGRVCVSDFGLSRVLEGREAPPSSAHPTSARAGTGLVGTPGYMSPEQLEGRSATPRSDQYSFCVSLYEALHGVMPPSTDTAREREAAEAAPAKVRLPPHLRRALERGLRTDPRQRHPSMNALLDELTRDPGAQRRYWLGLVAALGAVGVAGMLARDRAAMDGGQVCRGGEARLAGIWDEPRRAAVERALLATGKPFARDVARGVRQALDAYARDWVSSREGACEATRLRGEQSGAMLDLRMQCADRQLAQLRGLVDTLARADGDVAERALQATRGLPPAAECTAAQLGGLGRARRDDPAVAEALGRAAGLRLSGKYADAQKVAQQALDAARAGEHGDQIAQAEDELGMAAHMLLKDAEAEGLLFEALATAQRQGADGFAARVAVQLSDALGTDRKLDEAERWLSLSAALVERIGGDPDLEAGIAHTRAMNLYTAGRYRESIEEQERGLRLQEALPPDPLRLAGALNTLAGSLRDAGDLERAQETVQRALEGYEASLGPAHPRTGSALFNLGVLAMDRGRYEEGRAFHARSLATAEGLGASAPLVAVRASSLGHALALLGRFEEAGRYLAQARAIVESQPAMGKDRVARVFINLGHLARLEREYPKAEGHYRHALEVAPSGPHEQPDALLGLGRVLIERGDAKAAREPLERAKGLIDKGDDHAEQAEVRVALARALWERGDRARAAALAGEARAIYDKEPAREGEAKDLVDWLKARGAR